MWSGVEDRLKRGTRIGIDKQAGARGFGDCGAYSFGNCVYLSLGDRRMPDVKVSADGGIARFDDEGRHRGQRGVVRGQGSIGEDAGRVWTGQLISDFIVELLHELLEVRVGDILFWEEVLGVKGCDATREFVRQGVSRMTKGVRRLVVFNNTSERVGYMFDRRLVVRAFNVSICSRVNNRVEPVREVDRVRSVIFPER